MKRRLYSLLPDKYTDLVEREAKYARIDNYRDIVVNTLLGFFPLLLIFIVILQIPIALKLIIMGIGAPMGFFIPYAFITLSAERRKKEIERVLPDALLLMSANIKSGLTVDKAFLLSARDEFGPLAKEIRIAAMEMFGGKSVENALRNLRDRSNSEMLREVTKLLIDGVKSGGEISDLLKSSANDIRRTTSLRKEIASNVRMYVIFIVMAAVLGAPLLFGISNYLTATTSELWSTANIDFSEMPSTGLFKLRKPEISPGFFANFSIAAIVLTSTFAALTISEIKNGNAKEGIKYAPIFVIISLVIFFVVRKVVANMIGGLV